MAPASPLGQTQREIERAQSVADQLQRIADSVHKQLEQHQSSVDRFRERIATLTKQEQDATWRTLCEEAETILRPTLQLANQIAYAYDEIRHQTSHLMTFSEVRTDALTGIRNRRALDEHIQSLLAMKNRYEQPFSVAIFDIDHFKKVNDELGHVAGDRVLRTVATVLNQQVRETDFLARYGGEEFVVVMPQTDLAAACLVADRIRYAVEQHPCEEVALTLSGGVALIADVETAQDVLQRADMALYDAKLGGRNRVHSHNGSQAEPATSNVPALV
jgi:diguanylate cyclase